MKFPFRTKDEYFGSLRKKQRHLFKKVRRSRELVELEIEAMQSPDERTMDAPLALFSQTYEKSKTKFERLNRRWAEVRPGPPPASSDELRCAR